MISQPHETKYPRTTKEAKALPKRLLRAKGKKSTTNRDEMPSCLTETNVKQNTLDSLPDEKQWDYAPRCYSYKGNLSYHMVLLKLCLFGVAGCAWDALFPCWRTRLGEDSIHKAYKRVWERRYGHLTGRRRPPYPDYEVWKILQITKDFCGENSGIE